MATVVITTKNRKEELGRTLDSCVRQHAEIEVLVIDDGSTDETDQFVRAKYPGITIVRSEEPRGLIVQRNAAAKLARANILISIDDDAEFSSPDIVSRIVSQFDESGRIAAVAIPFINVRIDSKVQQSPPTPSGVWITNEFIGTAYAIRKDVFLAAGGFREFLFHQGEEGDLCIRLLDRGLFVRCGNSEPILHYLSPNRSWDRVNIFGQRNLILFAWFNVPLLTLGAHVIGSVINGLRWGVRHGGVRGRLRGTLLGFRDLFNSAVTRKPVRLRTYRLYRRLKKRGPLNLENIAALT